MKPAHGSYQGEPVKPADDPQEGAPVTPAFDPTDATSDSAPSAAEAGARLHRSPSCSPPPATLRWLLLPVALVALLFALRLSWLFAPVQLAYNEGWNAMQAGRLLAGAALYPPPGGLIANNYPPLSFHLVAGLSRLTGDPIIAGRIVSLLAVAATAAAVAAIVRRLGRPRSAALLAATLFLIVIAGPFRAYFATDDPQWIGHALMAWAVVLLLSGRSPARILLAAALMLAGGLVKHNLLGLPLAVTLWLLLHDRRALGWWLAVGLIGAGAAAAGVQALYGADFWANLLLPRRMLPARLVTQVPVALLLAAVALPWARRLLARRGDDPRLDLLLLMLACSTALGLVQRLGEGVSVNAWFEALVALFALLGAALDGEDLARPVSPRRPLPWIVVPVLIAGIAFAGIGAREVAHRATTIAHARAWIARIAAIPGPVACVDLSLCWRAGKPFVLDFFNYSERLRTGEPPTVLVRALAEGHIAAAQTDATGGFTPAECARPDHAVTVIACRWRSVVHEPTGGYQLFVPR